MRISELIKVLSDIQATHGDLLVMEECDDNRGCGMVEMFPPTVEAYDPSEFYLTNTFTNDLLRDEGKICAF
jgi:hypothetical protein